MRADTTAISGRRGAAAAVLLLLAWLTGCGEPAQTPEAEIRELIRQTAEAAGEGELRPVADVLHPAYRDARGNDRDAIVGMLRLYLLRSDKLFVLPDIEAIEVHGSDSARVTLAARLAAANTGRLSLETGLYRFELDLVREDQWRVLSARWARDGRPLR